MVCVICSHVQDTIKGVTQGFRYKTKSEYAHFPTDAFILENGSLVEIWNFLGEKCTHQVHIRAGVACSVS